MHVVIIIRPICVALFIIISGGRLSEQVHIRVPVALQLPVDILNEPVGGRIDRVLKETGALGSSTSGFQIDWRTHSAEDVYCVVEHGVEDAVDLGADWRWQPRGVDVFGCPLLRERHRNHFCVAERLVAACGPRNTEVVETTRNAGAHHFAHPLSERLGDISKVHVLVHEAAGLAVHDNLRASVKSLVAELCKPRCWSCKCTQDEQTASEKH